MQHDSEQPEIEEDEAIDFDPSARVTQHISYRPVIMAAVSVSLMAGFSYFISQGLNASQGDMPTPENTQTTQAQEDTYWGDENASPNPKGQPPLDGLSEKTPAPDMGKQITQTVTLRFSDEATPTTPTGERPHGDKLSAAELTAQFTISEEGLWTQNEYAGEAITQLKPLTDAYTNLLFDRPYLKNLTRHTRDIIFSHEGRWYQIAHIGPLMYDPILGDPHPKSRVLTPEETPTN